LRRNEGEKDPIIFPGCTPSFPKGTPKSDGRREEVYFLGGVKRRGMEDDEQQLGQCRKDQGFRVGGGESPVLRNGS